MTDDGLTADRLPGGFLWGAVRAGIKASGNPDVAAAVAQGGAVGAAMYTSNRVVAAPVTVGRRHLLATGGRVGAVLVNSGNANCATGLPGTGWLCCDLRGCGGELWLHLRRGDSFVHGDYRRAVSRRRSGGRDAGAEGLQSGSTQTTMRRLRPRDYDDRHADEDGGGGDRMGGGISGTEGADLGRG